MAVLDDKFSRSLTLLKDLRPGTKNVSCQFIVIDKGTTNRTKDGSTVRKCRVADRSGSICFSLWNEQASAIEPGDILRLIKGYTSLWKGGMVLYSGKYGKLEKIGEFTMLYSEMPDMSSLGHDFLPHQKRSPQPAAMNERTSDLSGTSLQPTANGRPQSLGQSPGNGRMGVTAQPPGTGNWNGNNHLNGVPHLIPPPGNDSPAQDQKVPPSHRQNGDNHDWTTQPHPSIRTLHSDNRDCTSFSRTHMKTNTSDGSNHSSSNSSSYERHHPYQRPQGYEPRFAVGGSIKPGFSSRAPEIPIADQRVTPSRLR